MSNYPEHEKLKAIQDTSQAIGEFLVWLQDEKGIHLAEWGPERLSMYPIVVSKIDLMAEHFGIDQRMIEQEKRAMLEELRQGG